MNTDDTTTVTGIYALPGDVLRLGCDHEDLRAGYYMLVGQEDDAALLCLAGEDDEGDLACAPRRAARPHAGPSALDRGRGLGALNASACEPVALQI